MLLLLLGGERVVLSARALFFLTGSRFLFCYRGIVVASPLFIACM